MTTLLPPSRPWTHQNPSAYGTPVRVSDDGTSDWGHWASTSLPSSCVRTSFGVEPIPVLNSGGQDLSGSMVTFQDLGIAADQIIYGFSIFADDTDVSDPSQLIDWTNSTVFPRTTGGGDGGIDLVAGVLFATSTDAALVSAIGPGGYKADLNTWLKANAGITTATDNNPVTDWQDQWLSNHDAVTTGSNEPNYRNGTASATEAINFNPPLILMEQIAYWRSPTTMILIQVAPSIERGSLWLLERVTILMQEIQQDKSSMNKVM